MKKNIVYFELIAIFIPGFLVLYLVKKFLNIPFFDLTLNADLLAFIILSYIIGHFLQFFSKQIIEKPLWFFLGGRPSTWEEKNIDKFYKKIINKSDFIKIKKVFSEDDTYDQPLFKKLESLNLQNEEKIEVYLTNFGFFRSISLTLFILLIFQAISTYFIYPLITFVLLIVSLFRMYTYAIYYVRGIYLNGYSSLILKDIK